MKFISKISKQGEDYFIRIPRNLIQPELVSELHERKENMVVEVREWH